MREGEKKEEDKSAEQITASELYSTLTSLVIHAEQLRWTRLNTYLIVSSISIAAWAAIFAGTIEFTLKSWILFIICIPSFALGLLWSPLGWRYSCYMDNFHNQALDVERYVPMGLSKPFRTSEKRRKRFRRSCQKFTSSKLLVTVVPLIFSLQFLVLAIASFVVERKPNL